MQNPAVTVPAQRREPQRLTLLLPVPSDVTSQDVLATLDVLVRTTPGTVAADVVAAVAPGVAPEVTALLTSLSGDLTTLQVPQLTTSSDATGVATALAAAAAASGAPFGVALDPRSRPDLTDIAERIERLSPLHRSPLPFSHRPGALLARTAALAAATGPVGQEKGYGPRRWPSRCESGRRCARPPASPRHPAPLRPPPRRARPRPSSWSPTRPPASWRHACRRCAAAPPASTSS